MWSRTCASLKQSCRQGVAALKAAFKHDLPLCRLSDSQTGLQGQVSLRRGQCQSLLLVPFCALKHTACLWRGTVRERENGAVRKCRLEARSQFRASSLLVPCIGPARRLRECGVNYARGHQQRHLDCAVQKTFLAAGEEYNPKGEMRMW